MDGAKAEAIRGGGRRAARAAAATGPGSCRSRRTRRRRPARCGPAERTARRRSRRGCFVARLGQVFEPVGGRRAVRVDRPQQGRARSAHRAGADRGREDSGGPAAAAAPEAESRPQASAAEASALRSAPALTGRCGFCFRFCLRGPLLLLAAVADLRVQRHHLAVLGGEPGDRPLRACGRCFRSFRAGRTSCRLSSRGRTWLTGASGTDFEGVADARLFWSVSTLPTRSDVDLAVQVGDQVGQLVAVADAGRPGLRAACRAAGSRPWRCRRPSRPGRCAAGELAWVQTLLMLRLVEELASGAG